LKTRAKHWYVVVSGENAGICKKFSIITAALVLASAILGISAAERGKMMTECQMIFKMRQQGNLLTNVFEPCLRHWSLILCNYLTTVVVQGSITYMALI